MNIERIDYIYDEKSDIWEIESENPDELACELFADFCDSADRFYLYYSAVFDCESTHKARIDYCDFLSAYKKRDFDEKKENLLLKQSKEKAFRFLLNRYIVNFKPKEISKPKNLYMCITWQGKFVAIKKWGNRSINYDLSASERTLFKFLCFIEINKFFRFVNGIKDFNYKEKPLILINFPEFLDESFDYIRFLKQQKLNRKIIIIKKIHVPKTPRQV